jgi:uncharacterized protein (DUF1697 family)
MARYVALLRGINVGNNALSMERLRGLCAELEFQNVRTYVQSGNVLFDERGSASGCAKRLESVGSRHHAELEYGDEARRTGGGGGLNVRI